MFLDPRTSFLLFSQAAFDDLRERLDFQTRPSDQCAVYILHDHEFGYVFRLHTATVEDTEPPSQGGRKDLPHQFSNEGLNFLRLLTGGSLPGSNGPHRLVGND